MKRALGNQTVAAVVFLGVLPLTSTAAPAESVDLAQRLPGNTLLYVGWSGCNHAATAARDTALGQTLAEPQVRTFFSMLDGAIDSFVHRMADEEEDARTYQAVRRLVFDICLNPGAIAVIDAGFGETGPFVQSALVLQLGDRADGFTADLLGILKASGAPPTIEFPVAGRTMQQLAVPVPGGLFFGAADGYFILATGKETVEKLLDPPAEGAGSLAQSPRLTLPRVRFGGDADRRAMTLFVDVAALLERARMVVPMFVREQSDQDAIWTIVSGLGLDNVKSLTTELHFRQRGCFTGMFIHTDGPPAGLFAVGDTKPLSRDELALIPKQPYWASAFSLNLGEIYTNVMAVFASADPEGHGELTEAIAELEERLGLKLRQDLLDVMGEKFVVYDAPNSGGLWISGATLIMESSAPEKVQAGFRKIVEAIAEEVNRPKRRQGRPHLTFSTSTYQGHQIDFVNLTGVPMPVAPSWTTHENRVIVGLYPQMVMSALDRMGDGSPAESLLDNPDFAAAAKVLDGIGSTVTYVDTQRGAQQLYTLALPLAQMGAAMVQAEGFEIDISCFPTQQALTRHLFGHVATTRHMEDGVMYSSYGPLPIAGGSLGEGAGASTALAGSILLPSLSRARTMSKRLVSLANLRQISHGCLIYANDNRDEFPPDFAALIDTGAITKEMLTAPVDEPGAVSYVYLAGGVHISRIRIPSQFIVAHERTDLNDGQGVNVAFADGHAEFVRTKRFEVLLQNTQQQLQDLKAAQE